MRTALRLLPFLLSMHRPMHWMTGWRLTRAALLLHQQAGARVAAALGSMHAADEDGRRLPVATELHLSPAVAKCCSNS